APDVAGIDADLVDRVIEGSQRHLVIKMDIANEWNVNALLDLAQDSRILRLRHGDTDDLAAGLLHAADLGDGRFEVVGICGRRGVDRGRGMGADNVVADGDLTGLVPLERMLIGHRSLVTAFKAVRLELQLPSGARAPWIGNLVQLS